MTARATRKTAVADKPEPDGLIRSIADQLNRRRFEEIRDQCAFYASEFPLILEGNRTEARDRLLEIKKSCLRAAKAAAWAPSDVDWLPPASFHGLDLNFKAFGTTQLSVFLHRISELAGAAAGKIVVPDHRAVPKKDLCAHYAFMLVSDFAQRPATVTPGSTYLTVAGLLYELLTGSADSNLESSCRKTLKKNRDVQAARKTG